MLDQFSRAESLAAGLSAFTFCVIALILLYAYTVYLVHHHPGCRPYALDRLFSESEVVLAATPFVVILESLVGGFVRAATLFGLCLYLLIVFGSYKAAQRVLRRE